MLDLFNIPKDERRKITLDTLKRQLVPADHPRIEACWHRATSIGMTRAHMAEPHIAAKIARGEEQRIGNDDPARQFPDQQAAGDRQ